MADDARQPFAETSIGSVKKNTWKKGLKILHLNICHIIPKLDQLSYFICNHYNCNVDICGVSETFLNDRIFDREVNIAGYSIIRRDRINKGGGGLVVYVLNKHRYIRREDLEGNELESIWIELCPNNSKSFLVCNVYRPPDSSVEWYDNFESQLDKASQLKLDIIILGDFNVNLLDKKSNPKFMNIFIKHGLVQVIDSPTRVTQTTSSLLDHVYVTRSDYVKQVNVPKVAISDHFSICIQWCKTEPNRNSDTGGHNSIKYRNMKHFDSNEFLATLNSYDWQSCHVDDVNTCLANLNNNISKALNKHAPMVDKRVKTINKPAWLNKEIIHEMHYRDRLKANGLWNDYKKSRNRVTNMIKQYKSKHYIRGIQDARGNSKKMWKLVKDITGRETNTGPIILETNNEHIVEPQQITNVLNDHFLNVAEKVTLSLPKDESYKTPDELVTWISDRLPNEVKFDIPLITENEVFKALSTLDITKSTGVDKISPMFLKISSASISPHLTHIINTSIKSNTFPDLWKTAIVYPLHKSGSKANLDKKKIIGLYPYYV